MTNVYAWPPVGLIGWENHLHQPVSRSVALLQDQQRTSSALRARRMLTAQVNGLSDDATASGYMENLKELLQGGRHLVRLEVESPIWFLRRVRSDAPLGVWRTGGTDGLWRTGGVDGFWSASDLHGVAGTSGGWPVLTVTGLPPATLVIRPGELVHLYDGATVQTARAMRATVSDGDGAAVIRLMSALTGEGAVSLGGVESLVVQAESLPRSVQTLTGFGAYSWSFTQVFADEFPDGWVELNPWA